MRLNAAAGVATILVLVLSVLVAFHVWPFNKPQAVVITGTVKRLAAGKEAGPACPTGTAEPTGAVSVDMTVKTKDTRCWTAELAPVDPGHVVRLLISYKNTSRRVQRQVVVRVHLPTGMRLVPGSTYLADSSHPNGTKIESNDLDQNGLNIGNFGAGANAFLVFKAAVPGADDLKCGWTTLRPIAFVQPEKLNYYWNTASMHANKVC
ncbi:hypothetical protein [Nocardioides terrisoli]|uniref:hypothetical protein n=1 Tax=Nocardioides terrisoli TaxID=3388267 RepID=UPI00287B9301|nr:hypothetical protein [Nocardioides marmorisolisilvae]